MLGNSFKSPGLALVYYIKPWLHKNAFHVPKESNETELFSSDNEINSDSLYNHECIKQGPVVQN